MRSSSFSFVSISASLRLRASPCIYAADYLLELLAHVDSVVPRCRFRSRSTALRATYRWAMSLDSRRLHSLRLCAFDSLATRLGHPSGLSSTFGSPEPSVARVPVLILLSRRGAETRRGFFRRFTFLRFRPLLFFNFSSFAFVSTSAPLRLRASPALVFEFPI